MQLTGRTSWRKCLVCGSLVRCQPIDDTRRQHCVSVGNFDKDDLPKECWQKLGHPFAVDLLKAIPPRHQRHPVASLINQSRIALAKDILDATPTHDASVINWPALVEKYGGRKLRQLFAALPESSVLRDSLDQHLRQMEATASAESPKKERVRPKREKTQKRVPVELPADLERAVQLFSEANQRRLKLKLQRGHEYREKTAARRTRDARRFCEFLAGSGIQFWQEVSQRHLDRYVIETSRGAGQHAYPFLMFVSHHFRMMQRFTRPRNKRKPPAEAVYDPDRVQDVLVRIVQHKDLQIVVIALFLALYAQTIVKSSELKLNAFRREDGRLMVCFAQQWIQLDDLTEKFLCKFRPEMKVEGFVGSDERLFTYTAYVLAYHVEKLVGVRFKPLRLAAVANVIRSGVIDRGSICRILGVSLPTLAYLEATFHPDLQKTIPQEIVEARNEVFRGERTE